MANDKYNMTGGVGSWLYMAPEVVRCLGCSDEMGSIIVRWKVAFRTMRGQSNLFEHFSGLSWKSMSQ